VEQLQQCSIWHWSTEQCNNACQGCLWRNSGKLKVLLQH